MKTYVIHCDCGEFGGFSKYTVKASAVEDARAHVDALNHCGNAEVHTVIDERVKSRLTVRSRNAWPLNDNKAAEKAYSRIIKKAKEIADLLKKDA